jgi:hypothetical protein
VFQTNGTAKIGQDFGSDNKKLIRKIGISILGAITGLERLKRQLACIVVLTQAQ